MLVSNADADDLVEDIHEVLSGDVVHDEFTLVSEIYSTEVLWLGGEEVTRAGAAGILESVVLHGDEPGEGDQIGNNDIWSHHIEHVLLSLK